jgi:hypothetical protein
MGFFQLGPMFVPAGSSHINVYMNSRIKLEHRNNHGSRVCLNLQTPGHVRNSHCELLQNAYESSYASEQGLQLTSTTKVCCCLHNLKRNLSFQMPTMASSAIHSEAIL